MAVVTPCVYFVVGLFLLRKFKYWSPQTGLRPIYVSDPFCRIDPLAYTLLVKHQNKPRVQISLAFNLLYLNCPVYRFPSMNFEMKFWSSSSSWIKYSHSSPFHTIGRICQRSNYNIIHYFHNNRDFPSQWIGPGEDLGSKGVIEQVVRLKFRLRSKSGPREIDLWLIYGLKAVGDKFLLSSDSTSKWSPVRPLVRRGRLVGRHICSRRRRGRLKAPSAVPPPRGRTTSLGLLWFVAEEFWDS